MITKIKICGVCVRDQQKARAFYTEKLGFEVRRDEPMGPNARWIEVAPKGAETTLVLFTPPGLESRIGTFANIVIEAKDIQKTHDELVSRGVEFAEAPKKAPWGGMQAQFVDPDGNRFVLVEAE